MAMIPYGRQDISAGDIDAVARVLRSDFLTQGPEVPAFEKAVADYCGAAHAVAVNSATSALHIACLALGVGPGDWVWTSPITFVASANCALYCGARIDFVDINPATFNMSVDRLGEKLQPIGSARNCNWLKGKGICRRLSFRFIWRVNRAIWLEFLRSRSAMASKLLKMHPMRLGASILANPLEAGALVISRCLVFIR